MIIYEKNAWVVITPLMPNFVKATRLAKSGDEKQIAVGDLLEEDVLTLAEEMKQEFIEHCRLKRDANRNQPA